MITKEYNFDRIKEILIAQVPKEKVAQFLERCQKEEYDSYVADVGEHMLLWCENGDNVELLFVSNSTNIRALEFMDYLISDAGLIKGKSGYARGTVSRVMLTVKVNEYELNDIQEYFLKMVEEYYTKCQWIYAREYSIVNENMIRNLPVYVKRHVPWAFVRSTDIIGPGEKIVLRSLENESGVIITAHAEVYIMIGCRGEIYDISREKFQKTYEVSEEQLDVFEQMLDFLPEVKVLEEDRYISIDELAYLCYPKKVNGIYAKCLTERTKIFTTNREQEYFVGHPGDYMAIRKDDITDMYVIQGDIFQQTYTLEDSDE